MCLSKQWHGLHVMCSRADTSQHTFPGFCFAPGALRMASFLGFLVDVPSSTSASLFSLPVALSDASISASSSATPAAASSSACAGSAGAARLSFFAFAAEALSSLVPPLLAFAAAPTLPKNQHCWSGHPILGITVAQCCSKGTFMRALHITIFALNDVQVAKLLRLSEDTHEQ